MKNIITMVLFLSQLLYGGWFDRDEYLHSTSDNSEINKLLKKSVEENKYVIIEASSKGCPYCARMNSDVFDDDKVRDILKEYYVFIKVDITNSIFSLPLELHKEFTGGTPTFFVLSPEHDLEDKYVGSMTKDEFLGLLEMYME
jgi:thioredoxin-related protein